MHMKKAAVICLLFLAGCGLIGSVEEFGCGFMSGKTQDHCYQDAAVRKADADTCAHIKAESFTELQGPAPRDKCYLRVAEKTGDPDVCDHIEGGTISYSVQECLQRAALTAKDPSICEQITGSKRTMMATFNKESCLKAVSALPDIEEAEEKMEEGEDTAFEGECKWDNQCPDICEGNVRWKQGCNGRTNTCEKTFDYPCAEQTERIAGYSFGKICQAGACVRDASAIQQKRTELSNNVKEWLAQRQEVTALMQQASKNCLSGLSDVTNKLIIDTALKLASPPTALLDVGTDATMNLVDALATDPSAMSTEEFISLNCNLYKSLQQDLDVLQKKIDNAQNDARALQNA